MMVRGYTVAGTSKLNGCRRCCSLACVFEGTQNGHRGAAEERARSGYLVRVTLRASG